MESASRIERTLEADTEEEMEEDEDASPSECFPMSAAQLSELIKSEEAKCKQPGGPKLSDSKPLLKVSYVHWYHGISYQSISDIEPPCFCWWNRSYEKLLEV